jgi:hypothetical protein
MTNLSRWRWPRPMTLLPMMLALGLTACAGSTGSGKTEPPNVGDAPAALVRPCDDPQLLPDRALTRKEIAHYWAKDRKNLVLCRDSKGALVGFYRDRDRRLGGNK